MIIRLRCTVSVKDFLELVETDPKVVGVEVLVLIRILKLLLVRLSALRAGVSVFVLLY